MKNIFWIFLFGMNLFMNASGSEVDAENRLIDSGTQSFDALASIQRVHHIDLEQDDSYSFNPAMGKLLVKPQNEFNLRLLGNTVDDEEEIKLDVNPQALCLLLDTRLRKMCFKHEPKVLVCSSGSIDEWTITRCLGCRLGWSKRHIIDRDAADEDVATVHFNASYDGKRIILGEGNTLVIYSSDNREELLRHDFKTGIEKVEPIEDRQGDIQTCNRLSITTSNESKFTTHWTSRNGTYTVPELEVVQGDDN